MGKQPKQLISIGDAWVDPLEVVAADATFTDDDPAWANVRVILKTGHTIYGVRPVARVVQALRHPERESEADEAAEVHADRSPESHHRHAPSPRRLPPPRPLRGTSNGDG